MAESKKIEIIVDSDDDKPLFGQLSLRQIKETLLKVPPRKITRRLSDPGCSAVSTLNPQEILNSAFPPMQSLEVNKIDRTFNEESEIFNVEDDSHYDNEETMRIIDETKESVSSTSYGTSSRNLSDIICVDPNPAFEQSDIIIISDDDEPDEKKHCYKEEQDTDFLRKLREEIDRAFINTTYNIDDDIFSPGCFDREINVKMIIDITNELNALQNASSSSGSSTTSVTTDDNEDIKDGVTEKKRNDENDPESK